MTLVRKETKRGHVYRLDGKPVKGVTTLIGKGLPKPALPRWAAKSVAEYVADNLDAVETLRQMGRGPMVDALKAVPWQSASEAAARGTDVHAHADRIIHGEEVEVPDHLMPYVEGYVKWLDAKQPEVIWTERPVASRKWNFAGTFDAIVRMDDAVWLLDWKTSRGTYGDQAIQLAAYRGAEFLVDAKGEEVPMPQIDKLGVVHIRPDGTDLYEVTDPDAAWRDWLHINWTGQGIDRIDGYLRLVEGTAEGPA